MTLPPDDRSRRSDEGGELYPDDRGGGRFGRSDEPAQPRFDGLDEDAEIEEDELDAGGFDVDDFDDEFADDEPAFATEPARVPPNPVRPDPPLFAPVVFDDDEEPRRPFRPGGGRDGGGYESDAGLLRVLGLIAILGVVILALVLPFSPVSVIGGEDDEPASGISATARDELPALPGGLEALSKLYDITVPEGIAGPLSVEIQLSESIADGANLAYYTWNGESWSRIGSVQLAAGGRSVTGQIPAVSGSIAVLRRTSLAHSMAMIVNAGETPDPDGLASASLIVVRAAEVEGSEVSADAAALRSAQQVAGARPVYLGVTGDLGGAELLDSVSSRTAHIEQLTAMARTQDADGVYVAYSGVADAAPFTTFVTELALALQSDGRPLIVGVPWSGDGYSWPAIAETADALWVQAPADPREYFASVESVLAERGVPETADVSVVLDRRSVVTGEGGATESLTLVEALAVASTVDFNVEAIGPGSPVTLRTAYVGGGPGQLLHWDDSAHAVTFSYLADGEERTVWFQNEYSFAFALDAAVRGGFDGVAVLSASADGGHPAVWEPIAQFVEEGAVTLQRPYGPYLTPCWQAPEGGIEGQPDCWTTETDTTAVVWRAPEETGAYTVRLVVSEGTLFVGQEVVLRVGDTPEPEASEEDEVGEEEPTPVPTEAPEQTATPEPTPDPTETVEPTPTPVETETPEPTPTATPTPTHTPTVEPTSTAGPPGPGGN